MKSLALAFVALIGFCAAGSLRNIFYHPVPTEDTIKDVENFSDEKPAHQNFSDENPANISRCTSEDLETIDAYLLDLDGTIYNPVGLLPGAVEFFDWLKSSNTSYFLLSNGFKTKEAVSKKLANDPFKLNFLIPEWRVHTAGVALANYMSEHTPDGSNIFAVGTSIVDSSGHKDFITRIMKNTIAPAKFDTWNIRTDLTMDEIEKWSDMSRNKNHPTYVVYTASGDSVDLFGDDPITHKSGYSTMNFELAKKVSCLLRNGAFLIAGSPDIAESRPKSKKFPNIDTSWPTTGAFESLFLWAAEMFPGTPKEKKFHVNTGKGGNLGSKYMIQPGLQALRRQKPDLQLENVMIVGDNFGTDILVGNDASIKSMLVLVGAHQLKDAPSWSSRPTCYLESLEEAMELVPKLY